MQRSKAVLVVSLSSALLGVAAIVVMLVVPFALIGGRWDLVLLAWPQFLVGASTIVATAALSGPSACEELARNPYSLFPLCVAPAAFVAGVLLGSAANAAFLGDASGKSLVPYFVKPVFWFCVVGLPCSVPFGFVFRRRLRTVAQSAAV